MNRTILLLIAVTIGLSAKADYTVQTNQPLYPTQSLDYSALQPYGQSYPQQYNQGYYQNPYQTSYQNPYQAQCQGQYANPYQYRNTYGNNLAYPIVNSAISGLGGTGSTSIVKNIGQSMLFSLLRGY